MTNTSIGIFVISGSLSGAEKRFIRIAYNFLEVKINCTLIINRKLYEVALFDTEFKMILKELSAKNCLQVLNYNNTKLNSFKYFYNFLQLRKIIKRQNIQLLHCSLNAIKYTAIKRLIKVKIIAEITSPDIVNLLVQKRGFKRQLKYFDYMICVSESVYNKAITSLKKANISYNTKNITNSSIPFFSPNSSLSKINLDNKENLIVYASRFIDRKNPVLFAEAIKKVLQSNKTWRVAILGKGNLEAKIKIILANYINNQRVIVEHTSDVYKYFTKSKIFVSLIWPDNYPSQSILEAMYLKNTIIATNVGNTNKFVKSSNGFMIEKYDVETVFNTINKAISFNHKLKIMGEESRRLVLDNFSKDKYLCELTNTYFTVLSIK